LIEGNHPGRKAVKEEIVAAPQRLVRSFFKPLIGIRILSWRADRAGR
jgi:hypothetical protein